MNDRAEAVAVIDDDDAVRDSLSALLEAAGYDVDTYDSGRAFLNALPQALPACALVDVRMPEMDGLELQQRLTDVAPALPVIIITGHGDIAMAVRAIKAGRRRLRRKAVYGPHHSRRHRAGSGIARGDAEPRGATPRRGPAAGSAHRAGA